MKAADLVTSAVGNAFRSPTRTTLTVLAIFVGAFTLTLTNGLGTGVNDYIDSTVAEFGSGEVMTVTRAVEDEGGLGPVADGPVEYDPAAVTTAGEGGPDSQRVVAMNDRDLATLSSFSGVLRVEPIRSVTIDYVQLGDGTKYVATLNGAVGTQTETYAAGAAPDSASTVPEVAIPQALADGWAPESYQEMVGATVIIGVSDALGHQERVTATVSGVTEPGLLGTDSALIPNSAMLDSASEIADAGLPADRASQFASASVWYAPDADDDDVADLKARLADAGYEGTTLEDQLGSVLTIMDAIVLVLNVFAGIALVAAGFGLVNTLLMSVQERTREIGLMKAMGMGSARVFSLFSLEAAVLGLVGAALGTLTGMAVGFVASDALASGFLSGLPGLTLIAFDPVTVGITIALIVAMALLAGALPAGRAAQANPVESLRYE